MVKKAKKTAGQTRKTHKSLKTEPATVPAGGPSSTALATVPDAPSASLDLTTIVKDESKDIVRATPVPAEDPKKQWWYRPSDSKARKIAEKIVVHRAAGRDDRDIAKLLKTTEGSVRQYVYLAHKNGWLNDQDEPVDLEAELAMSVDRKVVRNIGASLDGEMTNWQTHEMTMAAAKGRGIFKNHETSKGADSPSMSVVAIQVVMPPIGASDQQRQITDSEMGGTPAYTEGELAEETP